MLGWIKKLLTGFDRGEAASERAAKALEDIAAALESARDRVIERLGTPDEPAALPAANGRRKLANVK